jgi:hypothetical protein
MVAFHVLGYSVMFSWDLVIAAVIAACLVLMKLFFNYIVLRWAAQKVIAYLEPRVDKWWGSNPVMRAVVTHFHNKGMGRGHTAKDPLKCEEGECASVVVV